MFLRTASHRLRRGTLVPIVAGVFAILVAAPVLATGASGSSAPSASGNGTAATSGVRAQEWWLAGLSTEQAWQTSKGAGITVAVLSTGVAAKQPDLVGDVTTGPDYTNSGRNVGGPYWGVVGTAVASIIAGHGHGTGDHSGIIGIAPESKILSVRVTLEYNDPLNATTAITERLPAAIAAGIVYAANHGAKVIVLPLDAGTFGLAGDSAAAGGSPAERAAVRYALGKGAVLIAPAGDNAAMSGQADYPAAYPGVLAVGATGRNGQLAPFSSRDSYVSLAAPGVDLMAASMVPSQSFGYVAGYAPISTTSAASAMAAGVAALIESKYPQLTVADVVRALRASASTNARVNAVRALSTAATLSPRVKTAPTPTAAAVKPHRANHSTKPAHKTAPPAASSMLASAVLQDAVLAVCGLILIVAAFVLLTRIRRARAQAPVVKANPGSGTGRGLHEHRRGRDVVDAPMATEGTQAGGPWAVGPVAGGPLAGGSLAGGSLAGGPLAGGPLADLPMSGASLAGGALTIDPLAANSLASGWPATASWADTGPGEVSHSPAGSRRPLLTPLSKSTRARLAEANMASPPWAPAPEPGTPDTAVPVMPSGWVPSEPGNGIRLPGDMPDARRTPEALDGPDLTTPFAGRDVLTQSSFGFAAAPVPSDYPAPPDFAAPLDFAAPPGFPAPAVFPVPTDFPVPATDFPAPPDVVPAPQDAFPAPPDAFPAATAPDASSAAADEGNDQPVDPA